MDRDLDVPTLAPVVADRTPDRPERSTERDLAHRPILEQEHSLFVTRGNSYRLNPSQLKSMNDLGRFRTVALDDLDRHRYGGAKDVAERDLRDLTRQGLVQIKSVRVSGSLRTLRVAVLTRVGREALAAHGPRQPGQALYAGFVKAREVPHDAAIYRMFHAERTRIERAGGQVQRIVLDYELKRNVYTPLASFRSKNPKASPAEYAQRQREVAEQFGLKVIEGRIPLPDLRIEYIDSRGDQTRVDLELATHHYHGDAMRTKAQAGFTFYADTDSAQRLSKVLEERDITVAILSL